MRRDGLLDISRCLECLARRAAAACRRTLKSSPRRASSSVRSERLASRTSVHEGQQQQASSDVTASHSGGFPATATMRSEIEAPAGGQETVVQSQPPANGDLQPPGPRPALTIVMHGGATFLACWSPGSHISRVCLSYRNSLTSSDLAGLLGPSIQPDDGAAGPIRSKKKLSNGRLSSANEPATSAVTSPSRNNSGEILPRQTTRQLGQSVAALVSSLWGSSSSSKWEKTGYEGVRRNCFLALSVLTAAKLALNRCSFSSHRSDTACRSTKAGSRKEKAHGFLAGRRIDFVSLGECVVQAFQQVAHTSL